MSVVKSFFVILLGAVLLLNLLIAHSTASRPEPIDHDEDNLDLNLSFPVGEEEEWLAGGLDLLGSPAKSPKSSSHHHHVGRHHGHHHGHHHGAPHHSHHHKKPKTEAPMQPPFPSSAAPSGVAMPPSEAPTTYGSSPAEAPSSAAPSSEGGSGSQEPVASPISNDHRFELF